MAEYLEFDPSIVRGLAYYTGESVKHELVLFLQHVLCMSSARALFQTHENCVWSNPPSCPTCQHSDQVQNVSCMHPHRQPPWMLPPPA